MLVAVTNPWPIHDGRSLYREFRLNQLTACGRESLRGNSWKRFRVLEDIGCLTNCVLF
ncbi:hypothetical protein RBWH47_04224 [Rhodopirellula baltica WH47]|uniref:Uncharacterized protein n=1 Tax=Rhodopirellula baltica WH47 TaxID=991778 RepID=F2AVY0_RHOBT|nr:hypothetical protein RBWH47_04224 [Rhodopirellula baltica WH47]